MEFRTDTLPLHNLQRNQVGTFACKCFNRHGETKSIMKIDVLCKCYFKIRIVKNNYIYIRC